MLLWTLLTTSRTEPHYPQFSTSSGYPPPTSHLPIIRSIVCCPHDCTDCLAFVREVPLADGEVTCALFRLLMALQALFHWRCWELIAPRLALPRRVYGSLSTSNRTYRARRRSSTLVAAGVAKVVTGHRDDSRKAVFYCILLHVE
ncbi:hypothetical protein HMN09_00371200 [Mycena chlorophos]|uniref:Uncharacterized protein n=1 Tax=Mycena chlorophos TaxID=658473 RepID=A0A8H6WL07_MYCCL|nr:hypothetical protein HMN09_00371200 [Mycena chlorophos]